MSTLLTAVCWAALYWIVCSISSNLFHVYLPFAIPLLLFPSLDCQWSLSCQPLTCSCFFSPASEEFHQETLPCVEITLSPSTSRPVQAPDQPVGVTYAATRTQSLTASPPMHTTSCVCRNAHAPRYHCQKLNLALTVVGQYFAPVLPLCPLLGFHWWQHCIGRFVWLTPVSWRAWHTPADRCRLAVSAGLLPWPAGNLQMNSLWWVPPGLWA